MAQSLRRILHVAAPTRSRTATNDSLPSESNHQHRGEFAMKICICSPSSIRYQPHYFHSLLTTTT
ncbi:MAG: hypothetical protein C0483_22415 [Pirellula sp.]|nr:hypothetical protein [Pirellula sp.]